MSRPHTEVHDSDALLADGWARVSLGRKPARMRPLGRLCERVLLSAAFTYVLVSIATAADKPAWTNQVGQEILEKTQTIRLAPDLSSLGPGERTALSKLLAVGAIFQEVYEHSQHRDAMAVRRQLDGRTGSIAEQQRTLYRLFQGPVARTPDNHRVPFVAADPEVPGRNVYPWGITKQESDQVITQRPELRDSLLAARTMVRRADAISLRQDLEALRRFPVIAGLHPGLGERLRAMAAKPEPASLYAIPYALAYAPQMSEAYRLLNEAAAAIADDDPQFAGFVVVG